MDAPGRKALPETGLTVPAGVHALYRATTAAAERTSTTAVPIREEAHIKEVRPGVQTGARIEARRQGDPAIQDPQARHAGIRDTVQVALLHPETPVIVPAGRHLPAVQDIVPAGVVPRGVQDSAALVGVVREAQVVSEAQVEVVVPVLQE